MTREEFHRIEAYMLSQMNDTAHDPRHIYRVLDAALDIASAEEGVDMDVLLAACLLHDIGRDGQAANPGLSHAQIGADMAYTFLAESGWPQEKAAHVRDCVASHRYRGGNRPQSIEAKILFDADKLDATGAMGIARTLLYGGQIGEPLYLLDEEGGIMMAETDEEKSTFFQEYHYKLKKLYGAFHTKRAAGLAVKREKNAQAFYEALREEIESNRAAGERQLNKVLTGGHRSVSKIYGEVERFLDEEGRFKQWPARQSMKALACAYLAEKFAYDVQYTEPEVNAIVASWHTFGDYFLLRRELVDTGWLCRKPDGSRYWRNPEKRAEEAES